jgi:hypothetical protein
MTIDKANPLDVAPSCFLSCSVKAGILKSSRSFFYFYHVYPSFLSTVDRLIHKTACHVLKDKKSNRGKTKKPVAVSKRKKDSDIK